MNRWTLDDLDRLQARVAALEAVIKPPPPALIDLPEATRKALGEAVAALHLYQPTDKKNAGALRAIVRLLWPGADTDDPATLYRILNPENERD